MCAPSQSDSIVQTLQLRSCSFITLTHTSAAIMINVDLQTKNRSKYLHTNTMFHKCSTHEVRDTDLIFRSRTHTHFALVSQPSLHGNLRACSPWGELWWGYKIQRPSRTRERDREQCAYLKRWTRSQNNSSIHRAGGMMPHLHTNTHLHKHNRAPHTDQVENLLSYAFPHNLTNKKAWTGISALYHTAYC